MTHITRWWFAAVLGVAVVGCNSSTPSAPKPPDGGPAKDKVGNLPSTGGGNRRPPPP
jgi:hypothetical protein